MFKDQLEKMMWKINYEDILFVSAKAAMKPSRASLLVGKMLKCCSAFNSQPN